MKLEIKDLSKNYSDVKVLKGLNFEVNSGSAMGFLGRNGAGKTTFIRCLMNVFKPTSGEIFLDSKPFVKNDYKIGYLPEERGMYSKEKILNQLIYFGQLKKMAYTDAKKSALHWLEKFNLEAYAKKELSVLSKGNQQKVQIIQAIIDDPDILILDEPFSGLDPVNSIILKDMIKEKISQDKIVIFSSHQMSYVEEFCDDIAILNNGKIELSGNLDDIKLNMSKNRYEISAADNSVLEKYLNDQSFSFIEKNNLFIVDMNACPGKKILHELVSENIDIRHFKIYKPTLDQIFIEKAGNNENI